MRTVLLTGSTGFLGQHFKKFYVNAGWRVLTLGRSAENDIFWDVKLRRTISSSDFIYPIERIVHCAAINETLTEESTETTFDVNVTFTRTLSNLAIELDVKEFIYISTFHVYGVSSGTVGPDSVCRPINDYGLTHFLSEEILRNTLPPRQISTLCLRPTNIYGIPVDMNNFDRWTLVHFDFIKKAMEDKCIRLLTAGNQERNFVDICNVVQAEPQQQSFEVRDIYGNDTFTIKDFAQMVADLIKDTHQIDVQIIKPDDAIQFEKNNGLLKFLDTGSSYKPKGTLEEFIKQFSSIFCN
tara:strand:- start:72 stop:962 length:891 start_codon:yes stop_codon:yes gene_type:complete